MHDKARFFALVLKMASLVDRIAALNPQAGEIGPGMLAQLVGEARRIHGMMNDMARGD